MEPTAEIDVAILGAVPEEVFSLTELLESCRIFPFICQKIWFGKYSSLSVLLGTTGLGKVNAAITTASLLERFSLSQIWNVGCAGAFSEGPLGVGDVLITTHSLCGDEGIKAQSGILPISEIGIPLLVTKGKEYYDHFPSNWDGNLEVIIKETPPGIYRQKLGCPVPCAYPCVETGEPDEDLFRLFHGPSLTVGMASGDATVAGERFRRHGAYGENMEGSAVIQACLRFDVPAVECRGISNIAGMRSKETWQLQKSIAHCHGIVINWLETLSSLKLLK